MDEWTKKRWYIHKLVYLKLIPQLPKIFLGSENLIK